MNWQPTYHLYFPDMEVCEPDEHSHLEVYRLSIMGWVATVKYRDMRNVWTADFTTSDAAKEAAEKWRAARIEERAALIRGQVSEILNRRMIHATGAGSFYVSPKLDDQYPLIDIDRLCCCYEDAAVLVDDLGDEWDIDLDDVVGDYMKGEQ